MMSKTFTPDTLKEFWASRPNGARLQRRTNSVKNHWCSVTNIGPGLDSLVDDWRWEPQSTPVYLLPLMDRDVLCEFGHGIKRYGFLKDVKSHGFVDQDHSLWPQCKPVMGMWMAVSEYTVIPDGLDYELEVTGASNTKLVKFNGLQEGYHWPWEVL